MASKDAALSAPRLSIITTCKNNRATIKAAIDSVQGQTTPPEEHIVIDGGSTDGTLDILARYPSLTVISEPDDGAEDAFNKGLNAATGDVVGFVFSDDVIADGILDIVRTAFAGESRPDVVSFGWTAVTTHSNSPARLRTVLDRNAIGLTPWDALLGLGHPCARFYRRELLERAGRMPRQWDLCNDRVLMLRVAALQPRQTQIERVCYFHRLRPDVTAFSEGDPFAFRITRDQIAAAKDLLSDREGIATGPDSRKAIKAWAAAEAVRCLWRGVRLGAFRNALCSALPLTVRDPVWPVRGIATILRQRRERSRFTVPPGSLNETLPEALRQGGPTGTS